MWASGLAPVEPAKPGRIQRSAEGLLACGSSGLLAAEKVVPTAGGGPEGVSGNGSTNAGLAMFRPVCLGPFNLPCSGGIGTPFSSREVQRDGGWQPSQTWFLSEVITVPSPSPTPNLVAFLPWQCAKLFIVGILQGLLSIGPPVSSHVTHLTSSLSSSLLPDPLRASRKDSGGGSRTRTPHAVDTLRPVISLGVTHPVPIPFV